MNYLFQRFGKRTTIIYIIALLALAGVALSLVFKSEEVVTEEGRLPGVEVASVASLSQTSELSLVGSVSSISEVKLESEVGGRVTRVPVTLGQSVSAGTIIASVENSSEYASLLQAEGSYEAALAAAAKSDIGVEDAESSLMSAKQTAINANRSAVTTSNSVILSTLDNFFTNPRQSTPGLRISVQFGTSVNEERYLFNDMIENWQEEVSLMSTSDNSAALVKDLDNAIARVTRVSNMVSTFIEALPKHKPDAIFTEALISQLQVSLSTAKTSLDSLVSSLESAKNGLEIAEQSLASATISGTSGKVSASNASVKQALGALRAAQSSYNKTIIRTPISGTLNSLSIKAGDYITPSTFVANIANNNASVIKTFISDSDRSRLAVGQEVIINGNASGTVVAIAPGLDPVTKKAQVEIQSDSTSLINGATVRINIPGLTESEVMEDNAPLTIPVSALKVESNRVVVFIVSEDRTLVAQEVKEGPLQGTSIVIESGLSPEMTIVTDARGLNEGDKVEVIE